MTRVCPQVRRKCWNC